VSRERAPFVTEQYERLWHLIQQANEGGVDVALLFRILRTAGTRGGVAGLYSRNVSAARARVAQLQALAEWLDDRDALADVARFVHTLLATSTFQLGAVVAPRAPATIGSRDVRDWPSAVAFFTEKLGFDHADVGLLRLAWTLEGRLPEADRTLKERLTTEANASKEALAEHYRRLGIPNPRRRGRRT
jgi:hypothetical protein